MINKCIYNRVRPLSPNLAQFLDLQVNAIGRAQQNIRLYKLDLGLCPRTDAEVKAPEQVHQANGRLHLPESHANAVAWSIAEGQPGGGGALGQLIGHKAFRYELVGLGVQVWIVMDAIDGNQQHLAGLNVEVTIAVGGIQMLGDPSELWKNGVLAKGFWKENIDLLK